LKDKGRLNWRKTRSNISTVKKNYQWTNVTELWS
jgi:hypothetical protein